MKTCSKCRIPKEEAHFYLRADLGVPMGRCKQCVAEYRESLRAKDPEKFKAYFKEYNGNRRIPDPEKQRAATKKWRLAHPEECKRSHTNTRLKLAYGITAEDKDRMFLEQKGKCSICDSSMSPACVDHCHSTGKLRALLCSPCNTALGSFRDSPGILRRAIQYLERFSS